MLVLNIDQEGEGAISKLADLLEVLLGVLLHRSRQIHSIVCSRTRLALTFSRANPCLPIDEAFSWVFSRSHTLGLPHQSFRKQLRWCSRQTVLLIHIQSEPIHINHLKETIQNHSQFLFTPLSTHPSPVLSKTRTASSISASLTHCHYSSATTTNQLPYPATMPNPRPSRPPRRALLRSLRSALRPCLRPRICEMLALI